MNKQVVVEGHIFLNGKRQSVTHCLALKQFIRSLDGFKRAKRFSAVAQFCKNNDKIY
jgi:hypothetical protein